MADSMANRDHYGNGQGHGHEVSTEYTSHRPGPVRRAIAKVKNTTGLAHDTTGLAHETKASSADYQDEKPHPHPKVEEVVNTVGFSLIQEIMQYLKGPDGEEAMEVIFRSQSRVAARLALTEEAKRATRVAAEEAMTGTYDGVQHKCQEMLGIMPPSLLTAGSVLLGGYLVLLSVGVLFSLWRFALFGLQ